MIKKRIVIAGLGDTGVLTAINLGDQFEIIAISSKACFLSGQELGTRLTQLDLWRENYHFTFDQFKRLSNIRIIHGLILQLQPENNLIRYQRSNNEITSLNYDVLLIATGVSNGFWRENSLENEQDIEVKLINQVKKIAQASSINVIGGGASGVSAALNIKAQFPEKSISLYFSRDHVLPGYHKKTRHYIQQRLLTSGVHLFPGHRARLPAHFSSNRLTEERIDWENGKQSLLALCIWATGHLIPNSQFIPSELTNDKGFVIVNDYLQLPQYNNVFSVGDIAASDKNRSSARNAGYTLVANNMSRYLKGEADKMKAFKSPGYRWGSIIGLQPEGLRIFTPSGYNIRIIHRIVKAFLFPIIVRKIIYKGIKQ